MPVVLVICGGTLQRYFRSLLTRMVAEPNSRGWTPVPEISAGDQCWRSVLEARGEGRGSDDVSTVGVFGNAAVNWASGMSQVQGICVLLN